MIVFVGPGAYIKKILVGGKVYTWGWGDSGPVGPCWNWYSGAGKLPTITDRIKASRLADFHAVGLK